MKVKVEWRDAVKFLASSESGHQILMDGPEDHGGVNAGPRPMETLLMGVGGCSSFDVVHILKKSRQQVLSCVAQIEAERAEDEVPSVFTDIHLHFVVSGHSLKDNLVKRAVSLSAEKYCSAAIMLARGGVNITHSYEVLEA